jgi:hypothetical protein
MLQSNPQTVHWGFCDASLNPVLTIDSGDQVVINCVSGNPDKLPVRPNGVKIPPELENVRLFEKNSGNGALLAAAPPLVIYAFLMDYYIGGLTAGATKG